MLETIMCKCLLCQQREATKKGSHIIPSFFMKRINSVDGCNQRDHEVGFSIGLGTVETYFGREVYEDKRREYTDDESRMDDRTNLDTKDNVFCPECEKQFSKYESKYCQTYNLPFDKELVENTKVSGSEAALFWYGVIWRLSATKQNGISLNADFEEKLRKRALLEDTGNNDIYYALHYCKGYRKDNPTIALFDCSGNVAMLIVDEFMIVLFNGRAAARSKEVLWGMNYKCKVANLNDGREPEKIGLFSKEIFGYIHHIIFKQLLGRINYRGKFNEMHRVLCNQDMPESIYQELIGEICKAKLADRYTVKNYAISMKRVIQAHPEMYKVRFVDE